MTLSFIRIVAIADVLWLIFWIWIMTKSAPRLQDEIVTWFVLPGILVLVGVLTCGFFIQ